jgi:hypothetical protein
MRTLISRVSLVIAALGTIVVSVPSQAQTAMTKEQLAGTWQDLSFKATSDDKVGYPLGENPATLRSLQPGFGSC